MATTRQTAAKTPVLVLQPHGGALLTAGKQGNKGGSGRPPSALRARLRASFEERLQIAEEIDDDADQSPADRLRALALLGRYGLGSATTDVTVDEVRDKLRRTVVLLRDRLAPAHANPIIETMRQIWLE